MIKYNVGIIGLGGAGLVLLEKFNKRNECEVIAVLDTEKVSNRLKKDNFISFYDNKENFFKQDIQIVVVSSPDSTHSDYVIECINRGIHVLCEKPLTNSNSQVDLILKAKNNNPHVKVMVQHQMRNIPLFESIKKIIDSNKLGTIGYIEGYYVHNLTERAFVNHNWRNDEVATPLIYSGIHFIDLIMWMTNEKPYEVFCYANNLMFPEYAESDLNVLLMKFNSGKIAKVVTAFGVSRPQDHSLQVYGNKASIHNNTIFKDKSFNFIQKPISESFKDSKSGMIKFFIISSFFHVFKFLMKLYPNNDQYLMSFFPFRFYEHQYAVSKSVDQFMDSIIYNKDEKIPLIETANAVKVAVAGVESFREGKPVTINWD
mgnify:CR=1 FL=1